MATALVDVGTGTTFTLSTSTTFVPHLRGIKLSPETVAALDATYMGTTGYREMIQGDLKTPGQITLDADFNPSLASPLGTAAQTGTLTLPIPPGGSAGATIVGTGFFISVNDADIQLEDKMGATHIWQFDGFTGPTLTAAS